MKHLASITKPQDQWEMGFITNVCICIIKVFHLTPKKQQKIGNGWDLHREAVIKVMKLTKARIVENKSLLYTSDGSFHESSHPHDSKQLEENNNCFHIYVIEERLVIKHYFEENVK